MGTAGIIIILSLVFSAFFSGMEIAFISANKIHIEIEKKQEGFLAKVLTREMCPASVCQWLQQHGLLLLAQAFFGPTYMWLPSLYDERR